MPESNLEGKRIVLGVTGSIAVYKSATLASHLTQMGAQVDVIMTSAAEKFITPLTFQAVTGRAVYTSMWQPPGEGLEAHIAHIGLGHEADLLLVAPATANTLAKLAHGTADDLLSVTALVATCPLLVAPAMDAGMYSAAATQANVETLRARGVTFAGPGEGRMASGLVGLGRMIEPDEIIGYCRWVLGRGGPLAGRRVVVSAGPTREPLDPVRYLTNRSSGKQGYAIAQAAVDAGATVTLISGPVSLTAPVGVERIDVTTAVEMEAAVIEQAAGPDPADALIMAAAVGDFRPAQAAAQKIKKMGGGAPEMTLERNPDILLNLAGQATRPRVTVGFAAETEDLLDSAADKLARKKLDLIVANDVSAADAGFEVDTNRVHFVTAEGSNALMLMSKEAVAARIVEWLAEQLGTQ